MGIIEEKTRIIDIPRYEEVFRTIAAEWLIGLIHGGPLSPANASKYLNCIREPDEH